MIELTEKQHKQYLSTLEYHRSSVSGKIELCNDKEKNKDGTCYIDSSHALHALAKLEYILNKDKNKFVEYQNKSAEADYNYFTNYTLQENIKPQCTEVLIDYLFKFLSTGNIKRAAEFASLMEEVEIDTSKSECYRLSDFIHYLIKQLLQGKLYNFLTISQCIEMAEEHITLNQAVLKGMEGYFTVFKGIFDNSLNTVQQGFGELLDSYDYQCKQFGHYQSTSQEHLFYWGLGLANLCRYKGINIQISNFLIPNDLIIPLNTSGDMLDNITKMMNEEKLKFIKPVDIDHPLDNTTWKPDEITQRRIVKEICKEFNTTAEALKERKLKRINRYIDYINPVKYQLSTTAYKTFRFPKDEEDLAIQIIQHIGEAYHDKFFISQGVAIFKLPCSLYDLIDGQYSFAAYNYDNQYLLLDNEPYDHEIFLDFTKPEELDYLDQTFHCLQAYLSITGCAATLVGRKSNNQDFYFAIMQLIEDLQIQNIDATNFTDDNYIDYNETSKFASMEIDEYLDIIGKDLYKQGYSLLNIDTTGDAHRLIIVPNNVSKDVLSLMERLVLLQSKCACVF